MHDPSIDHPGGSHDFSHHPRPDRELERLRRQALAAWPTERELLARLGLTERMRVLDVGCGAGFVTEQIAAVNAGGETTGLEPDPKLAEAARKRFEPIERLSLHQGGILDNSLPRSHFDFVYARFVFQHLSEPKAALAALRELLAPGATLALVDADDALTLIHPRPPELTEIMRTLAERQARYGGDREVGRKLPGLLEDAGFHEVGFHLVPFTSHTLGRDALLDLAITSRLVRLDEAETAAIASTLERMRTYLSHHSWHGVACVIAASGVYR